MSAGCVPIPFASPPVRVTVGGGKLIGRAGTSNPQESGGGDVFQLRGGLHPFQLSKAYLARRFDVGGGYLLERILSNGERPYNTHGPYLEASIQPWQMPLQDQGTTDPSWWLRLNLGISGELLFSELDRANGIGGGASAVVGIEIAGFVDGFVSGDTGPADKFHRTHSDVNSDGQAKPAPPGKGRDYLVGAGYGEGGAELFLEAGFRRLHGMSYGEVLFGVRLRLPASIGAYLWFPD